MEINRSNKILAGLGVIVAILLGKIFYIQILTGKYKENALNKSMVYDVIYPPRGIIYDRNGDILVGNKVCYDVLVTPREVGAFDTLTLADALGVEVEFIRERMQYYRRNRTRIGYRSQTFLKQVSSENYMRFA